MTTFLGWIHKEADHMERFLKLKTESAQITLSEKHVIFYTPKGRKREAMTTTFADLVEEGDLLEVVLDVLGRSLGPGKVARQRSGEARGRAGGPEGFENLGPRPFNAFSGLRAEA